MGISNFPRGVLKAKAPDDKGLMQAISSRRISNETILYSFEFNGNSLGK